MAKRTAKSPAKSTAKRINKLELHPRNPHRARYDFALLADSCPALTRFIQPNKFGNQSIDFADPLAVRTLNWALLNHFYGVAFWDIPAGYLCPPIPGRADYLHYLADLLADSNSGVIPRGRMVKVLDIGVGANCVYPIIGHREYGWQFVGSDINPVAVDTAQTIVRSNACLTGEISVRLQTQKDSMFAGIWRPEERFDLTLCNPPFHTSAAAMTAESDRKWRGLKTAKTDQQAKLNFGGQAAELWCDGGEVAFVSRMIRESKAYGEQCYWFTSLVAKQASLAAIYAELTQVGAKQVRTIEMAQGQKVSRFVAWSFLQSDQQNYWQDTYWQD